MTDVFEQHREGVWNWLCPNCHETFAARSSLDMDSARRRQEFEKRLGFEVSVKLWDSLCDKCQGSYLWFASVNKARCSRVWKKVEEMYGIQAHAVHGEIQGSGSQPVVEIGKR